MQLNVTRLSTITKTLYNLKAYCIKKIFLKRVTFESRSSRCVCTTQSPEGDALSEAEMNDNMNNPVCSVSGMRGTNKTLFLPYF